MARREYVQVRKPAGDAGPAKIGRSCRRCGGGALLPLRRRDGLGVLPDIPHEQNGLLVCQEDRVTDVVDRHREFEAIFMPVPKLSTAEKCEPDLLAVLDHVLDAHGSFRLWRWWRAPVSARPW